MAMKNSNTSPDDRDSPRPRGVLPGSGRGPGGSGPGRGSPGRLRRQMAFDGGEDFPGGVPEIQPGHGIEQSHGIGVAGMAEEFPGGACSTMSPAYITATRSAVWATIPRLWVMNNTASPNSALSWASRARIWAWMVTSRAVVGSSAMSSSGSRPGPWPGGPAGACPRRAGGVLAQAVKASGSPPGPGSRPLPARPPVGHPPV